MSVSARPSRRTLLGASAGALGAVGALGESAAAATPPGPSSLGEPPVSDAQVVAALPALAANESSVYFGPLGWSVYDSSAGATVIYANPHGSRASSGYLGTPLNLEAGTAILGLDLTMRGPGAISGSVYLMQATPDTPGAGWASVASAGTTTTSTVSTTIPVPIVVTPGMSHSLEVVASVGTYVHGVRVRYRPRPGLFVPITPARVYDSRLNMTPDANGTISAGANRTVSVANGRSVGTGAVTSPNVVPAGAKAIAYTLTVTGGSAGGYLAVNPGGDTVVHASTINFSAGQTLANTGAVSISAGRTITVVAGAGTTQFMVDVVGYYL